MKYLFMACILSLGISVSSQSSYTPDVLQNFTDIYLAAKSIKIGTERKTASLMHKNGITPERYRSILHYSLTSGTLDLAPNELAFVKALRIETASLERQKMQKLKLLLEKESFDFELYSTLENKYKTELKFQRSLKPYFENSLKKIHK